MSSVKGVKITKKEVRLASTAQDGEWIEKIRVGETKAFSMLVTKYQKLTVRLAFRFVKDIGLAEDVAQESFLKAYQHLDSFESRASFKSWLFQITVNTAKNKLRDRFMQHSPIEDAPVGTAPSAEVALQSKATGRYLTALIDHLPDRQRTAVVLRVYEDLSFQEIANIMACPYDTAKANFRHGLLKIKREVEKNDTHQMGEHNEQTGWEISRMRQMEVES